MNYLSKIILSMVLLGTSLSIYAAEIIRVAVVFDTGTTSISSSQRYYIARDQVDFLNDTIYNSGLNSDIKFQLVVDKAIKFASTFDDFDDVQNKYLNVMSTNFDTKIPSLPLNKVSRDSQVDIVIAIFNPWGDNDIGGRALMVPDKNMGESVANILSFADAGIVFIHEDSVNDYTMVPHEVGHTFGLFHGNAVAEYTGESGHYTPLSAVDSAAHGYGTSSGTRYGTIMTGYHLDIGKPTNSFSNPNKYNCGPYEQVCGDFFSDATSVLKQFKTYYGKRGDFYN